MMPLLQACNKEIILIFKYLPRDVAHEKGYHYYRHYGFSFKKILINNHPGQFV